MNYPLISEYIEAIKSAEDNFEELSYLRPVLGDDGLPVMTSGNFAVVFKMKDEQSGKFYAVKCFTKEQEGRAEAYREIAKELKDVSSPYLVSIQYLEKELFVDTDQSAETEFPVLLMDWVEGKTLDKYLRENLDDKYALEMLAYRFSLLAQWLIPQPFAHGDLKPDNILVREDGTLVLVDYDGMYVPAMKGQKARELGSPDFRHPLRTENDFDEHIDDFPLVSIQLSLKAISLSPQLLCEYGAIDRLIFSESDYHNLYHLSLLPKLCQLSDYKLNQLISLFLVTYIPKSIPFSWQKLLFSCDFLSQSKHYSLNIKKDSFKEVWVDDFGVKFSVDRVYLLEEPIELTKKGTHIWKKGLIDSSYIIPAGTIYICDKAFFDCRGLSSIKMPTSIKAIGSNAFESCRDLKSIDLNYGIEIIGNNVFKNCTNLTSILIPRTILSIGKDIFEGSSVNHIYSCYGDSHRIKTLIPQYKDIIEELPF